MATTVRERFRFLISFVISAALVSGACGKSPIAPSPAIPKLTLTGPSTIAPGASARYQVTATYPDGKTIDVSSQVIWLSSNPHVVEVRVDGLAIGLARGEVMLSAIYDGTNSPAAKVFVLESGTFKLSGRVTDRDAGQPVIGATLDIDQGIGAGLRATTDATGGYAVYGVAGDVRVGVSNPGFVSWSEVLTVSTAVARDIALTPQATSSDLTGLWDLTIAGPACTALPEPLRVRRFTAVISQTGSSAYVAVSGPTLTIADPLKGRVFGDVLSVPIPSWPGDVISFPEYALLESIQPAHLGFRGTISATLEGDMFQGSLDGAMDYYATGLVAGSATDCPRPAVTLRRR
jgi:hypothetical protein